MCLICIELDRSVMTFAEARRALGEMRATLDSAHADEVEGKIAEAERASSEEPPPVP